MESSSSRQLRLFNVSDVNSKSVVADDNDDKEQSDDDDDD